MRPNLLMMLALTVVAGCCLDEDCWYERRCISSGGLTCAWVQVCPDETEPAPEELDLESRVFTASGGRWDVRVDVSGTLVEDGQLVAVGAAGPEVELLSRLGSYRRWWYHAWPAGSLNSVAVALSESDDRLSEALPAVAEPILSGCNALSLVNTDALAPIPEQVTDGDSVYLYSPPASELVPTSSNQGIVVYLTPPSGDPVDPIVIAEGQSASVTLDRLGVWYFRLVLFSEDLCEAGAADAVVVQEAEVEVVAEGLAQATR